MKIDAYSSQKIKILSFWMIVMVVYVHSYYLESETRAIPNFVQTVVGVITSVAVPLFYTISGFLFFNGITSTKQCFPKIGKRTRTLLVPYLIWNIFFVLWYVVLSYIPYVSQYINSDILSNYNSSLFNALYNLFIKPAGFHLWFLRDLILFILVTPFLYVFIKKTKWIPFVIILLATGGMTRCWLSSFTLGSTLALCYKDGLNIVTNKVIIISAILFYFIYSISSGFGIIPIEHAIVGNYISQLSMLVFMVAIWGGYDMIVQKDYMPSKWFLCALDYSFFIYLFHEPAFNIVKKLGLKILGVGNVQLVLLYIVNPLIMVGIAVGVGCIFKCIMPKIYNVLTGGR